MLAEIDADTCSGCGQPLSETLRPEAFEGYEAADPNVCQGCKALIAKQRRYADDKDLHASRFSVRRIWEEADPHGG